MTGADLGRDWSDAELGAWLKTAAVPCEKPEDIAVTVARTLADNGIVAWFQGRSEYGPGHSATVRCSPIPGTRGIWSGSTT